MKLIFVAVFLSMATTLSAADLYYIAHRGEYMTLPDESASEVRKGRVDAPEGTRPAFERVRDNRVNAVKLDIQYTLDKVSRRVLGDPLVWTFHGRGRQIS